MADDQEQSVVQPEYQLSSSEVESDQVILAKQREAYLASQQREETDAELGEKIDFIREVTTGGIGVTEGEDSLMLSSGGQSVSQDFARYTTAGSLERTLTVAGAVEKTIQHVLQEQMGGAGTLSAEQITTVLQSTNADVFIDRVFASIEENEKKAKQDGKWVFATVRQTYNFFRDQRIRAEMRKNLKESFEVMKEFNEIYTLYHDMAGFMEGEINAPMSETTVKLVMWSLCLRFNKESFDAQKKKYWNELMKQDEVLRGWSGRSDYLNLFKTGKKFQRNIVTTNKERKEKSIQPLDSSDITACWVHSMATLWGEESQREKKDRHFFKREAQVPSLFTVMFLVRRKNELGIPVDIPYVLTLDTQNLASPEEIASAVKKIQDTEADSNGAKFGFTTAQRIELGNLALEQKDPAKKGEFFANMSNSCNLMVRLDSARGVRDENKQLQELDKSDSLFHNFNGITFCADVSFQQDGENTLLTDIAQQMLHRKIDGIEATEWQQQALARTHKQIRQFGEKKDGSVKAENWDPFEIIDPSTEMRREVADAKKWRVEKTDAEPVREQIIFPREIKVVHTYPKETLKRWKELSSKHKISLGRVFLPTHILERNPETPSLHVLQRNEYGFGISTFVYPVKKTRKGELMHDLYHQVAYAQGDIKNNFDTAWDNLSDEERMLIKQTATEAFYLYSQDAKRAKDMSTLALTCTSITGRKAEKPLAVTANLTLGKRMANALRVPGGMQSFKVNLPRDGQTENAETISTLRSQSGDSEIDHVSDLVEERGFITAYTEYYLAAKASVSGFNLKESTTETGETTVELQQGARYSYKQLQMELIERFQSLPGYKTSFSSEFIRGNFSVLLRAIDAGANVTLATGVFIEDLLDTSPELEKRYKDLTPLQQKQAFIDELVVQAETCVKESLAREERGVDLQFLLLDEARKQQEQEENEKRRFQISGLLPQMLQKLWKKRG